MKADLASATMVGGGAGGGGKSGGGKFTREELRALFSLNTATASDTRDLLPPGRVAGLRWLEPEEVGCRCGACAIPSHGMRCVRPGPKPTSPVAPSGVHG